MHCGLLGMYRWKNHALSLLRNLRVPYRMTNIHQLTKCEFEKKSKPKPNGNPLDRIKSVDPTTFLSNYNTLYEQIKRAWYIASIYKTATEPYPSFENDPVDYGYKLSNNRSNLEMKWFHGDQVPASLEEIIDRMNSLMIMMMI